MVPRTVMLSHISSLIQLGAGLGACCERSSTAPPLRKYCHSSVLTWETIAER